MTPLTLRATSSSGPAIHNLVDWERYAAITGKWADGFSAKELARLWLAELDRRPIGVGRAAQHRRKRGVGRVLIEVECPT